MLFKKFCALLNDKCDVSSPGLKLYALPKANLSKPARFGLIKLATPSFIRSLSELLIKFVSNSPPNERTSLVSLGDF